MTMSAAPDPDAGILTLPLLAERVAISRRTVPGDTVRVQTVTRSTAHAIEEDLVRHSVEIERVPIGRRVEAVPPVRQEGDTTILPVVEEVVVVERRLMLKEEVRIRRVRTVETHRETVMVRSQDAVTTRVEAGPLARDDRHPLGTDPTQLAQEQQT